MDGRRCSSAGQIIDPIQFPTKIKAAFLPPFFMKKKVIIRKIAFYLYDVAMQINGKRKARNLERKFRAFLFSQWLFLL